MRRGFTVVECLVVCAIAIILLGMICTAVTANRTQAPLVPAPAQSRGAAEALDYHNNSGQFVTLVEKDALNPWLSSHADCEIVCLTAVSNRYGDCNPTTGFIVVYRRVSRP